MMENISITYMTDRIKKQYLILVFTCVIVSSCQTVGSILSNTDYSYDQTGRKKSFALNEPFPKKGYKLTGMHYHNIEIHQFIDNDTLYYLKYNPKREERNFYFTVLEKQTVDAILVNTLDKDKTPSVFRRREWLDNALIGLGIRDIENKDGQWTYFVPRCKLVKGNLPTDVVKTGFHYEYETFNYNTAKQKYYEQRHPRRKITGMEILGALYIINMLTNSANSNNVYTCRTCGISFSNPGYLRSHEIAVHEY